MRQITTILIILITQIKFLSAQQSFDNDLLLLEQKIYSAQSTIEYNRYCFQKFDLYIVNKNYSADALKEAKRIDYRLLSDSVSQFRFLWNSAIIAQLNEEKTVASYYLDQYRMVSADTSLQIYLFDVIINNGFNSDKVSNALLKLTSYNKQFGSLSCLNELYEQEIKNKIWYPIASALLPGLGSIINGNLDKGASSLAINAAAGYAIYLLIQNNLYLNAIFWGTGVGLKFYVGNIKLTTRLVEEKALLKKNTLAADCKCVLNELLIEHPLEFK